MKKYRIGILGATGRGNYGHQLDTAWLDLPNTTIVGVSDGDSKGLAAAAKRVRCDATFADYQTMMDETKPDIVAICPRWVDQRADMLLAAVERGIHCFVEKPFCRTPGEADRVIAAAEMSHARIGIAHPTSYAPVMQTVRKLIRDGAIGRVLELRGRGKEDHRGGGEDLWVLGCHLMDMVLALGYAPEWCFSSMLQNGERVAAEHVQDGNEGLGPLAGDAVRATFGLKQGMTYSFNSYRGAAGSPTRFALRIYGSRGIIEIMENVLAPVRVLQNESWTPGRGEGTWKKVSSAGIDQPEPLKDPKYRRRHHVPIEDLIAAIENNREPACGMYRGRSIIEMVTAVFESHLQNAPVTFPLKNRDNPLTRL